MPSPKYCRNHTHFSRMLARGFVPEQALFTSVGALTILRSMSCRRHLRHRGMIYRQGLRVTEAATLRLDQLTLKEARLWVKRSKGSQDGAQPIAGDELRAIKRYLAIRKSSLPWMFVSERGEQFTRQGIAYIIREAAERAGLGHVWPHMLRHSCGYHLANRTQVPPRPAKTV